MKLRASSIMVLVLLALAVAGLVATFIHVASDKGVALWVQIILFIVDIGVMAGVLLSFDDFWDLLDRDRMARPKGAVAAMDKPLINARKWPLVVVAIANAITFPAAVIPFLNPAAAVESGHGVLELLLRRIEALLEQRLPPPPTEAPIVKFINGRWGHDQCHTVYQVSLDGTVLHIERVAADSGAPPYKRVGTVVGVPSGNVLNTRADDGGADQGMSSTFTFEGGGRPTLTWDDRNHSVKSVLSQCP